MIETPSIEITTGALIEIKKGRTYAITFSRELPKQAIDEIMQKFTTNTGAKLIILVGVN